jgi:hypothetical protein
MVSHFKELQVNHQLTVTLSLDCQHFIHEDDDEKAEKLATDLDGYEVTSNDSIEAYQQHFPVGFDEEM